MNQYAASAVTPRSGRDAEGQLCRYFRALAVRPLMSAEDEIAAAWQISERRRGLWAAILEPPGFTSAVTDLLLRRIPADAEARADLTLLRAASRARHGDGSPADAAEFSVRCAAAVERMITLDVDGRFSDEIVDELDEIAAGDPGERALVLTAELRPGYLSFAEYRRSIRTALAALRAARSRFVEANLRLVVVVARRQVHGTMSLADRIQEGNLGLLSAIGRFDPTRGCRFATYAVWWIRSAIVHALTEKERTIRLPQHIQSEARQVARARRYVRGLRGGEPTLEALAAHTGLTTGRIDSIDTICFESSIRFDGAAHPDGAVGGLVEALVDGGEGPNERLDAEALRRRVHAALAKLRPLEAEILCQRFGLNDATEQSLTEIAQRSSISRVRARQLEHQALHKIRVELRRCNVP